MSLALLTRGFVAPTATALAVAEEETVLTPIDAPFEVGDEEYVDHVGEMLSRLVYQLARVS